MNKLEGLGPIGVSCEDRIAGSVKYTCGDDDGPRHFGQLGADGLTWNGSLPKLSALIRFKDVLMSLGKLEGGVKKIESRDNKLNRLRNEGVSD